MKKYWVTALVSASVLAFIVWLGSHLSWQDVTVRNPLRGEALHNPYYAAIKFSKALGAEAQWERVFTLPAGDTVIMLASWNWTLSRTRRERIERWVESGGRLVVDASLIGGVKDFERWSGIGELEKKNAAADESEEVRPAKEPDAAERDAEEDDAAGDDEPSESWFERFAPPCHALTESTSGRKLDLCGINDEFSLTTTRPIRWSLRDGDQIEALRTKVGLGSVTVINATPFQRRDFLRGDHATVFAHATQLHRGDSLLLLTEEEHASLPTLVWRFGAPVVLMMLAAIALSLWRATARFGPPLARAESARRSLKEQIRGTGQFALRFGGGQSLHAAAARALRDAARQRLPAYDRMTDEERIAALAKLSGIDGNDLGPALNHSGPRSAHELRNSIGVIETARRRILLKGKRSKHGN